MWARIKPSISSALIPSARPSLWACSATAIATAADTSRSDVTGGSKLPLGFARAGDTSASALAAAMNIESVTRRALTAIAHDRPTVGPNLQILRGRFGPGGWVRQRKDDRPFIAFRHGAHHRFGEGAGLARDSDQYAGSCVPHHIQERDLVRVIQFPSTGNRFFLHKRLLIRADVIHPLTEEPVAIDHEKAPRRIALLQTGIHHSLLDKGGDAAACRACAQYDETLLSTRHLGNFAR